MTIIVQLSVAGLSTTVFNLYSDVNYSTPLVTGITKAALLEGYSLTSVPDNATTIRVTATGVCTNSVDLPISGITTTSTTSSTTTQPTTTSSTTSTTSTSSTTTQPTTSSSTTTSTLPTTTSSTTSTSTVPPTTSTSTSTTSTTSTTTTPPSLVWTYDIELYSCTDCSYSGGGQLGNAQQLTVGMYYKWLNYKILILDLVSVEPGTASTNIAASSGTETCEELVCDTTTTTTTAIPAYSYPMSVGTDISIQEACNSSVSPNSLFSPDTSLDFGSILYTEPELLNRFIGGNLYYKEFAQSPTKVYTINNDGEVISINLC